MTFVGRRAISPSRFIRKRGLCTLIERYLEQCLPVWAWQMLSMLADAALRPC